MRVTVLLIGLLLTGLVFMPSCLFLDIPWDVGAPYQAEFHKVLDFAPGGTLRLDNASGDVEIRGWDEDRVEVSARQEGGTSFGWSGPSRWSARPAPKVSVESTDQTVTIKTLGRQDRNVQPIVHYFISVPRNIRLKDIRLDHGSVIMGDVYGEAALTIGEGDLTVENYSGSLEASLVKGSAEAEVLDLRAGDKIVLGVDEGDIILALEKGAGAKLEMEAPGGKITSEFDLKLVGTPRNVSATLGDGGASVALKTRKGNVRLVEAK